MTEHQTPNFTCIVKPTIDCNLNCSYCYSEGNKTKIMTIETLERTISQTFDYCKSFDEHNIVDFTWHGGEPLLAPLTFYQEVLRLQKIYCNGIKYQNAFQTNATLVNQELVNYIKEHNIHVSISMDGPAILNNSARLDKQGNGTFTTIMEKINLLRKADIPIGICVVLYKAMKGKENELYDFFCQEKLPFKLIPLNRCGSADTNYNNLVLTQNEFAEIWINLFERWANAKDEEYINCVNFSRKISAVLNGKSLDCYGKSSCSKTIISVDPDGFVFPCATFTGYAEWSYGNINTTNLEDLMKSENYYKMIFRKTDSNCQKCKWHAICHGGCPSRAYGYFGSIDNRDYYCRALKTIYSHVESFIDAKKQDPNWNAVFNLTENQ